MLMTGGEKSLLARIALGVATALAGLLLVSIPRLRTISDSLFDRLVVGGLVLSRTVLFAFVFFVLHLGVRGDISLYYWPEALAAMHGSLPYRDFASSYAPLHPYLDSLVVRLWHSDLSIVILAIVAEFALLPLCLAVFRRLFPEQQVRVAALLYIASPLSMIFVCVDGQDNVVIALLMAAALLLVLRSSETLSGAAVALALSAIKILPLLFVPVFFLAVRRRWRWAGGAFAVIALVYGASLAIHLPITQPITAEGSLRGAGNVPYFVESALGTLLPSAFWSGLGLAALVAIILFAARIARGQSDIHRARILTFAMPAIILALVLLSRKSWPNYLMLTLFPLCLLASQMRRIGLILFSLFSIVAIVEHSYWSSLFLEPGAIAAHALIFHSHPLAGDLLPSGLVLLEALLLAGYGWLLMASLRAITMEAHLSTQAGDISLAPPVKSPREEEQSSRRSA